jgi:nucleoside-diphosphate-sugar epimerase
MLSIKENIIIPERVVILGAGGFISNALEELLIKSKIQYLVYKRNDLDLAKNDSVSVLVNNLKTTDVVIFIAAKAPVKDEDMLILNLNIGKTICEALKKVKVKHLIYVSSDAVYADSPTPLTEASLTSPESLHGIMHLTREIMLKNVYDGPLCIIRPTLIYGPKDPHNGYGPNKFIRLAKSNIDVEIFGNGEEKRDHVFIDDLANIIFMIILNQAIGVLNVATGKLLSFLNIVETTIDQLESKSKIIRIPRKSEMPHNGYRAFDISNFKKMFPEFEYRNFEEIIKEISYEYK